MKSKSTKGKKKAASAWIILLIIVLIGAMLTRTFKPAVTHTTEQKKAAVK
ncbi:MAG: hypothetical protein ABI772_12180 [Bacteroidota bacterium]